VGGAIGVAGIVAADGRGARLEVAALTVVTLAGFLARARWTGMPPALLAAWTFTPAIVLNLQERGEGTMFLLVVALCHLVVVTPDGLTRLIAGGAAVLTPAAIQAATRRTGDGRSG